MFASLLFISFIMYIYLCHHGIFIELSCLCDIVNSENIERNAKCIIPDVITFN